MSSVDQIKAAIRDVPDFPQPGIVFKDITPVLANGTLFRLCIDLFSERCRAVRAQKIAGIDARGFIFAAAVADRLGIGMVPVRKQGKLPYKTYDQTYTLEYGSATISIHADAFVPGERVVLIDDVLATGGTLEAAASLVERAGGDLVEVDILIELGFLHGRQRMAGHPLFSAIIY